MQIVGAYHYEPQSKLQLELVWLWIWIKIGLFGHRYINISHISYAVDDLHGQMAWNHLFRIRMANSLMETTGRWALRYYRRNSRCVTPPLWWQYNSLLHYYLPVKQECSMFLQYFTQHQVIEMDFGQICSSPGRFVYFQEKVSFTEAQEVCAQIHHWKCLPS